MSELQNSRQDWLSFFMDLSFFWAERSTCVRRKVGAIAVKNKRVIASGYNGVISGHEHCTPETCFRTVNNIPSGQQLDMCYALHAEQNLILQAAGMGGLLSDCDVYCTTMPCHTCLKLLLNLGIKSIYFAGNYDLASIKSTLEREAIVKNRTACQIFKVEKDSNSNGHSMWIPVLLE